MIYDDWVDGKMNAHKGQMHAPEVQSCILILNKGYG